MSEAVDLPLHGMRVVDTADDRGELCGRLLADLGAEVIRVEPPGGAPSRSLPPHAPGHGGSLHFACRNAGKRSLVLDLTSSVGCDEFKALLEGADVWIESGAPGAAAAMGLDPEALRASHPHLIIASITDFGQTGPHRDYLSTDMIGYAMGGMMYRAGAPHRPPLVAPGQQAYDTASISAAFGVLAAALNQRRSGMGDWLDISVQEAVSNLSDWSVPLYSTMNFYQHRNGAGAYPLYRCRDGFVRMVVMSKHNWAALLDWMGHPEALADPAFEEYFHRYANHEVIDVEIQKFLESWTKEDAAREAQRCGITATPLYTPGEAIDNEHTRARGSFVDLELFPGVRGRVPSGFFECDGKRLGPRAPAPQLDALATGSAASSETAGAPPAAAASSPVNSDGIAEALPFAGLRVIDFGMGVAGAEVARLLGDYGADVIKVESSTAPDFMRLVIPGAMNPPFASTNRGKRSVGVNVKTPEGLALAHRLLAEADVMVENSATGVMERLGLGYEAIRAINPRIVMFSTQMLGAAGPWGEWSGYGPNTHAVSGLQYLWNLPEDVDQPAGSANIHPDHLVGRLGALGIAAALLRRQRTGRGAYLQVAQFEVVLQLIGDLLAAESLQAGSVQPLGNESERGAPWGVFPCAGEDEHCVVNVRSDDEWRALCKVLGRADWLADEAMRSASGRRAARALIEAGIGAWTQERAPVDAMEALQAAGVPAGVVQHPAHQVGDAHLVARGFFQELDQRGLGQVTLEGTSFLAREIPTPRASSAPLLGQHTREICGEVLGLSAAEIEELLSRGVLDAPTPEAAG